MSICINESYADFPCEAISEFNDYCTDTVCEQKCKKDACVRLDVKHFVKFTCHDKFDFNKYLICDDSDCKKCYD